MLLQISNIINVFSKLASKSIDRANSFLLAYVQLLIHMWEAEEYSAQELEEYVARLRDGLLEVADKVNPYINAILGVLEEGVSNESIEEALRRARELWRMEKLDKLEV